jgi:membrane protein
MLAGKENPFSLFYRRTRGRLTRIQYNLSKVMWIRFSLALARKIGKDDISNMAAGIAYYAFLSLFPLLLSLLFFMDLILPSDSVINQLGAFFTQFLPGSPDLLKNSIKELSGVSATLGVVGIIGLLWAATGVFSATTNAFNRAWDIPYNHPIYIKKPKEIGMVLGTGVMFLLSFGFSTLLAMLGNIDLPLSGILVNIGTIVIAFILSLLVFLLLNKLLPVVAVRWRHVWPGALISTVLFEVAKTFFVFYVNAAHTYTEIYGSIASIVIVLVWIYYSAFIVLLGAEFNSMLVKMKREGDAFDKTPDKVDIIREL